jgi:hypothetical protein
LRNTLPSHGAGHFKQPSVKIERFFRVKKTVQVRLFGQIPDFFIFPHIRSRFAQNAYVTTGWEQQPQQQLDGCRLAGTVRTEQTENFPFMNLKV